MKAQHESHVHINDKLRARGIDAANKALIILERINNQEEAKQRRKEDLALFRGSSVV